MRLHIFVILILSTTNVQQISTPPLHCETNPNYANLYFHLPNPSGHDFNDTHPPKMYGLRPSLCRRSRVVTVTCRGSVIRRYVGSDYDNHTALSLSGLCGGWWR